MKPRKSKQKDGHVALTMDELDTVPFRCVNCSAAFEDVKLYCSELCVQEAEWVRYRRRCLLDGRDQDPEVKQAIKNKLALILGGG